jgi:hypothetical protein
MTVSIARLVVAAHSGEGRPFLGVAQPVGRRLLAEMFQRLSRLESDVIRLQRLERETTLLAQEASRQTRQTLLMESRVVALGRRLGSLPGAATSFAARPRA